MRLFDLQDRRSGGQGFGVAGGSCGLVDRRSVLFGWGLLCWHDFAYLLIRGCYRSHLYGWCQQILSWYQSAPCRPSVISSWCPGMSLFDPRTVFPFFWGYPQRFRVCGRYQLLALIEAWNTHWHLYPSLHCHYLTSKLSKPFNSWSCH